MIDTHSHLYEPEFAEDREAVLQRARQAGVERILLPNINNDSREPMLELCRLNPGYCYPMLGLHPEDVRPDFQPTLDAMRHELAQPGHPYIAVGEVGLDFYWDQTYANEQAQAFRQQVQWAVKFRLPLMIHCRAAHRQMVDVLNEFRGENLSGVFHCFGGTMDEATELLSFPHFVLGIGGVVTFKKSPLPEVLRHVPLERIVLETDSPYLAPVPHRGQRNESSFLVDTCHKVAEIYEVTPAEVERVTNATVRRIFRL